MARGLLVWLVSLVALVFGTVGVPTMVAGEETAPQETSEKRDKEKVEVLPEMVVTATKTEQDPANVPASISIVTQKDIERRNVQTTDGAMKLLPGTYVRRGKGWADTLAAVNLRGFPNQNQSRTLVLLDGQDISTGYTNSVNWTIMPVENIERIEVVRGPFSALYGGNAMGGVINIITRMPNKLEMQLQGGGGTYNSWTTYLSYGNRLWDKVSFQINYKHQATGGYPSNFVTKTASGPGAATATVWGWQPTQTTTGTPTNIIGHTGNNSFFNHIVSAKLSWDIAPGHKLNFSTLFSWNGYDYLSPESYIYNIATGQRVYRGTVRLFNSNKRFTSLRDSNFWSGYGEEFTQLYNFNSEHQISDKTRLKFTAWLLNQPDNWYTTPGASTIVPGRPPVTPGQLSSSPSTSWNVDMQVDHQLGAKHLLTGGLVYRSSYAGTREYELRNWYQPTSKGLMTYKSQGQGSIFSAYIQDEFNLHPKVTIIGGVRLDYWQTFKGLYKELPETPEVTLPARGQMNVSPKLAVLYRPVDWVSLRASVGTAFRPPNVYELYRTWTSSAGRTFKGNPDLKPETNLGWEVGALIKPFKGNTINTALFRSVVRDLIYRVQDLSDPTGMTSIYQNAAQADIFGWELEINQKFNSWLEVFGNLTFVDARIRKNDYDLSSIGKRVTYVPRQMMNFGVNATYGIINANLTGHYVSKMKTRADNLDNVSRVYGSYDPYFTLDAKVTLTPLKFFTPALGKSFVSIAVDNILNRKYFYYYLAPRRTWWLQAGLKY